MLSVQVEVINVLEVKGVNRIRKGIKVCGIVYEVNSKGRHLERKLVKIKNFEKWVTGKFLRKVLKSSSRIKSFKECRKLTNNIIYYKYPRNI